MNDNSEDTAQDSEPPSATDEATAISPDTPDPLAPDTAIPESGIEGKIESEHTDWSVPPQKRRSLIIGLVAAALVVVAGVVALTATNGSDQDNLSMIKAQPWRNKNHDDSPYHNVKQADLKQADHLGPRADYLAGTNGNPEPAFPTQGGGQFRTACEFSHFGYDDPVVIPNQPGAAHLHMFFGNTDVNAFTTQESLEDSGSSTCNGQELNRSSYWVPAMFDGNGNVRIPERIVVYYKGEGFANGGANPIYPDYGNCEGCPNPGSQAYERGMRNLAPAPLSIPEQQGPGSAPEELNYKCSDNFSSPEFADGVSNIPDCDGSFYIDTEESTYPDRRTVLEMQVKFHNCWPTENTNYEDYEAWQPSANGDWFWSDCDGKAGPIPNDPTTTYPNMSYFVNYVVEPGESTADWFLSSDVDPATMNDAEPSLVPSGAGSMHHGDVWWAWLPETNQTFLDNCINFYDPEAPSGCGFGYLSNGGPDGANPLPGPALKYRPQYDTPGDSSTYKVPAADVFENLCQPLGPTHDFNSDRHAAWCKP